MKKINLLGRIARIACLNIILVSLTNAAVTTIKMDFLESEATNLKITITATITSVEGGVTIKIENDDGSMESSVTRIFFHDKDREFLGTNIPAMIGYSDTGISFASSNNETFPGGNAIGFVEAFRFIAAPPPVKNGLNPGESVTFSFGRPGLEHTEDEILALIKNGDFRIGVHVQGISGNDGPSASYVSHIPEPTTALLGCLGTLLLLTRRRS
jgi:hypothetical protein